MARAPKAFQKLAALSRERQSLYDKYGNPRSSVSQTDRGAAMLAQADLERALDDALQSRMPHLNPSEIDDLFVGERAALGTFNEKIWIGYAMHLYGRKTWIQLDRVRRIRNAFAHARKPIKFSTTEVVDCCALLTYTERIPRPDVSHYSKSKRWPPPPSRAKDRYLQTTKGLASALAMLGQWIPDPDYPLD